MDERRRAGLKVWTPLLFSLIMIFGMVIGFNLRDSLRSKRDIQTIIERNDRLEQIIDLINEKYVDSVNANVLYEDAVNGILSHLDPHTVYIPTDELQSVNDDLDGSFFGIGVEFSILRDTIQVTSVVEGGPAERAGVETGDQLIKVQDSIVAGTGITSDRIVGMLRGKEHSKVLVTLRSSVDGRQKRTIIERGSIPLYSIEADIMLDGNVGYIKINRFSATTYAEFAKALKKLTDKGAKSLVIDVRQNPGGYLEAATGIADELLDGDKLIVYTKGRKSPKMEYKADKPGIFERGKLAILVDEGSASASEILAGAVQDWDRGVIVGRRTFGKGLVQEQYEMDNGSALRLTIAKYYTPSGRSIQRSYAKGKEAYADDISRRFESGALTGNDTLAITDTSRYYTFGNRTVYGNGGIMPDIYVPYDTSRLNATLLNVVFSENTKNILWDYFIKNRSELKQFKTVQEFNKNFHTSELINAFVELAPPDLGTQLKQVLDKPASKSYFEVQLKAQLARFLFRNNGYYTVYSSYDPVLQKALGVLRDKTYSSIIKR
jgi:carboxyl-terminal processing protease